MKATLEPSDSSGATKMEVPEKKQYKNSTGSKMEPVEKPPTYAENEGGGDKKSKQYKESKITGAKKEPVINPPTYADLGIDKKDAAQIKLGGLIKEMPKNEGAKGQLIGRDSSGATKMEGPENKGKSETLPPTYAELGITYKDAAQWKDMADHEAEIRDAVKTKKETGQPFGRGFTGGSVLVPPVNKGKSETPPPTYNENHA